MNAHLDKLNVIELLEKYSIEIPAIQRDYSFGREDENSTEKRQRFIKTIFDHLETTDTNKQNLILDFIYGKQELYTHLEIKFDDRLMLSKTTQLPLINSLDNENNKYILLDGQQRITTLWLLLIYFKKELQIDNSTLHNFKYKTRNNTEEFCNYLINEWDSKIFIEKCKQWYKSSPINFRNFWFNQLWKHDANFHKSWINDPTIKGMIIMLECIHHEYTIRNFSKKNIKRIKTIRFFNKNFNNLGDIEDLYLKMNSRGKPLSKWEILKNNIDEILNKNEQSQSQKSINKIKSYLDVELVNNLYKWFYNNKFPAKNLPEERSKLIDDALYILVQNVYLLIKILEFDNEVSDEIKCETYKHYSQTRNNIAEWRSIKVRENSNIKIIKQLEVDDILKISNFLIFLTDEKSANNINKLLRVINKDFDIINEIKEELIFKSEKNKYDLSYRVFTLLASFYFVFNYKLNECNNKNLNEVQQLFRVTNNLLFKIDRIDENVITNIIFKLDKCCKERKFTKILKNEYLKNMQPTTIADQIFAEEAFKMSLIINNNNKDLNQLIYDLENSDFSRGSFKWFLNINDIQYNNNKFNIDPKDVKEILIPNFNSIKNNWAENEDHIHYKTDGKLIINLIKHQFNVFDGNKMINSLVTTNNKYYTWNKMFRDLNFKNADNENDLRILNDVLLSNHKKSTNQTIESSRLYWICSDKWDKENLKFRNCRSEEENCDVVGPRNLNGNKYSLQANVFKHYFDTNKEKFTKLRDKYSLITYTINLQDKGHYPCMYILNKVQAKSLLDKNKLAINEEDLQASINNHEFADEVKNIQHVKRIKFKRKKESKNISNNLYDIGKNFIPKNFELIMRGIDDQMNAINTKKLLEFDIIKIESMEAKTIEELFLIS